MMTEPKIGQIVRLNDPRALTHMHRFEVVAVFDGGRWAEIRRPGLPRIYRQPVSKLIDATNDL